VDALPSCQAESIAVAALEALDIRALERAGYRVTHQKGSHVRLKCEGRVPVTVPIHAELDRGTLRSILRTTGISTDELLRLLA
jgi:predicted RNA binding protein YcfA (HicA-like mRNA interferase family)